MPNIIKKIGEWLAGAIKDSLTAPINELREEVSGLTKAQTDLAEKVEQKHADDPAALECDLSLLDDRICYLIDKARARGYTAGRFSFNVKGGRCERRRVDRMHQAYQSRGGNHGEEAEYAVYRRLPTEEEWKRTHGQA